MYENLIEKYGITEKEVNEAVQMLMKSVVSICNVSVMLAITDLLGNGDIQNTGGSEALTVSTEVYEKVMEKNVLDVNRIHSQ